MQIAVVGNCQVNGVLAALRFLLPGTKILSFQYFTSHTAEVLERARQFIAESDYVFAHYLPDAAGPLSTAGLRQTVSNLLMLPNVSFTGFHPDCVFISSNGSYLHSPLGLPHSTIIAAAYSLDLDCERVPLLFNSFIYRKLGYYDEFAKARSFLQSQFKRWGLDFQCVWNEWMTHGVFMHTPNHPRIHVLASIARITAAQAGILPGDAQTPILTFDYLAQSIVWPVYRELADSLDVPGSYMFKRGGSPHPLNGDGLLLSLEEMVASSYERYKTFSREVFKIAPIARVAAVLSGAVR